MKILNFTIIRQSLFFKSEHIKIYELPIPYLQGVDWKQHLITNILFNLMENEYQLRHKLEI